MHLALAGITMDRAGYTVDGIYCLHHYMQWVVGGQAQEGKRLEERLPEGMPSVTWEGVEDVPILFVNQVLGQVGQQSEVILTFGQLSPPAILGEDPEERERQLKSMSRIPIKPIARLGLTRAGLEQLVAVLHQTLDNYDKAQEFLAQAQSEAEQGEG
jgi:hypothetical protein